MKWSQEDKDRAAGWDWRLWNRLPFIMIQFNSCCKSKSLDILLPNLIYSGYHYLLISSHIWWYTTSILPWYHIQLWNVTPATQQSPSQEKYFDNFRFVWTRKLRIGWDWGMAGLGRIYIIHNRISENSQTNQSARNFIWKQKSRQHQTGFIEF